MGDLIYDGEGLRAAGSNLNAAVAEIPITEPLAMDSVSATDVTVAARSFNMWVAYTGLVARAQLTSVAESTHAAAAANDRAESEIAANAGTP